MSSGRGCGSLRLKGGLSVEHPIAGDELRAIKRYLATREDNLPWLFVSERRQRFVVLGFIAFVCGAMFWRLRGNGWL